MARKPLLFSLAKEIKAAGIRVILVQIAEAHSTAWPIAFEGNRHTPQTSFEDRCSRAAAFAAEAPPELEILVCGWDDEFELKFRAWPDKYYFIDPSFKVLEKSDYIRGGEYDAVIANDYAIMLKNLLGSEKSETCSLAEQ